MYGSDRVARKREGRRRRKEGCRREICPRKKDVRGKGNLRYGKVEIID